MDPFSSALAVLSAMITPAVLISACGTLVLSTSTRLGRLVDRVRDLSDRFEQLVKDSNPELQLEKRAMILSQLELSTGRARPCTWRLRPARATPTGRPTATVVVPVRPPSPGTVMGGTASGPSPPPGGRRARRARPRGARWGGRRAPLAPAAPASTECRRVCTCEQMFAVGSDGNPPAPT